MEITKDIFQYIVNHSDKEDDILVNLSRKTHLETVHPRMLSGHLQGKFLEFISKMIKPERILEIGTFTGYSAICMAKGLSKNGMLFTIEINDERKKIIEEYTEKAGLSDKIKVLIGDAKELISEIPEIFDLAFIDADKPNYLNYYKAVLPKLKPGGFIIADNVLWDGKVVNTISEEDASTKGIIDFNDYIKNDNSVEKLMLPLRDGLLLIRKKT